MVVCNTLWIIARQQYQVRKQNSEQFQCFLDLEQKQLEGRASQSFTFGQLSKVTTALLKRSIVRFPKGIKGNGNAKTQTLHTQKATCIFPPSCVVSKNA